MNTVTHIKVIASFVHEKLPGYIMSCHTVILVTLTIHFRLPPIYPTQLNDLDVNGLNNLNDNSEGDENNGPRLLEGSQESDDEPDDTFVGSAGNNDEDDEDDEEQDSE